MFYAAEPFGPTRDNLHAGLIASVIVNALRKKGTEPLSPSDFLFVSADAKRKRSLADGVAKLAALAKPARGRKP